MSGGRMGKGGNLSASSKRSYESALRGLDGFLQGEPATDKSVAAHMDGLRRRGASRSSAEAVVSALAWRGRLQGVPSPCGSLCRAALKSFPTSAGDRGATVSPSSQRSHELALRKLAAHLDGATPTDALLAGYVRSFGERGLTFHAAVKHVAAAAWDAKRNGRASPKGPLTMAALAELPKRSGRAQARTAGVAPNTRRRYEAALRRLDDDLRGEPLNDGSLAAHLRGLLQARARLTQAVTAVSAASWRMALQGLPSPHGPKSKAAMRELQRAHVEGRLPRRGEDPDGVSALTRSHYESALRRMGAGPITDALLARCIRSLGERGLTVHAAARHVAAAAWDAKRNGRPSPKGPLTMAALAELPMLSGRAKVIPADLSKAVRIRYEAALRRLDARLQGVALDDGSLAGHLSVLLQEKAPLSQAVSAVSAASWRMALQGRPSPHGPKSKAVMRAFRLAHAEGGLPRRKGGVDAVSPLTRAAYEAELRRMGVDRNGPTATDALLERRIDGLRKRGKSVKSALRATTAATWDARRRGLASPVGPLTKAALKRLRRAASTRTRRSGAVSKATQSAYESAVERMRAELGAEPTTDALLAKFVAKALGAGRSAGSAAFHVTAAVWWAKRHKFGTPKGPLTEAALRTNREGPD